MADISTLSDLLRQVAYYQAGGKDPGYSDIEKGQAIVGNVGNIGTTLTKGAESMMAVKKAQDDIITNSIARKVKELELKKAQDAEQPFGQRFGVPTQAQQNQLNQSQVSPNIYPQPSESQENPAQIGPNIPQVQASIPLPDKRAEFMSQYPNINPDLNLEDNKTIALLNAMGGSIVYTHPTDPTKPPIILPSTMAAPEGYIKQGVLPQKTGAALAVTNANANAVVPYISGKQAIEQGQGSKNAKIITPQQEGINPYAQVKASQNIEQDLPSNQSPTTASGAAAQVQLAVRQGKGLIANPGSPQRLALAASDLARAVQRSAPQLDSLENAGFANNLITKLSLLKQKVDANPASTDVPKLRREVYDILDDLDKTSKPLIERQLQIVEGIWKDNLPKNWQEIRNQQLGANFPDIPFQENLQTISGPSIGTIKNGYAFRGGNPNDKNNWIKTGK